MKNYGKKKKPSLYDSMMRRMGGSRAKTYSKPKKK
jgi:hypothetical protein